MDMDRLREVVELLKAEGLTEITISEGDKRITVRRAPEPKVCLAEPPLAAAPGAVLAGPSGTVPITAPLVGTFYRRATPESPPLVEVGQIVHPGDTVCIIEAMKVMNEIKAECSGTVMEVCVRNAQPVEYGQVLFRVKP